jgi:hypothetical protein
MERMEELVTMAEERDDGGDKPEVQAWIWQRA